MVLTFLTEPVFNKVHNGWQVAVTPMVYQGAREKIVVPVGFISDGASVPRWLWSFLPRDGDYFLAAVLHDWLYHSGAVSRRDADRLFLRVMLELDVSFGQWFVCWVGVRIGGWAAWRKHRSRHRGVK